MSRKRERMELEEEDLDQQIADYYKEQKEEKTEDEENDS